ncbi:twin-arginine translocase TatA/TatE family subunit [bacterium]|nr:twin-arginine translocase TatA/TatE family subunit [bacterium]
MPFLLGVGFGTTEIVVIAVVALIFFGPGKIKEFARSIGASVGEFKGGLKEGEKEIKKSVEDGSVVEEEEPPLP